MLLNKASRFPPLMQFTSPTISIYFLTFFTAPFLPELTYTFSILAPFVTKVLISLTVSWLLLMLPLHHRSCTTDHALQQPSDCCCCCCLQTQGAHRSPHLLPCQAREPLAPLQVPTVPAEELPSHRGWAEAECLHLLVNHLTLPAIKGEQISLYSGGTEMLHKWFL